MKMLMKGIKPHTHEDRREVVERLVPILRRRFGENFSAFGALGSFARSEDAAYSDLECVVFLKKMGREHKDWEIRKIIDGLLVVVVPDTVRSYIKNALDIPSIWYATGWGKILPIANEPVIRGLNSYVTKNTERRCLGHIQTRWPHYQEITAKLLNAIEQRNRDAIAISFPYMMSELFVLLSFLNGTPYVSLGTRVTQARAFPVRPKGFGALLEMYVNGIGQDVSLLKWATIETFTDLEKKVLNKGVNLYSEQL